MSAARTACNLLHQVERAFRRTEIGQAQLRVSVEYSAHEHDIVEIETLRDHLRAQKHRRTGLAKFGEQFFMRITRRGGIGIHAHHARKRPARCIRMFFEHASQLHLHALRSAPNFFNRGSRTPGTTQVLGREVLPQWWRTDFRPTS